MPNNQRLSQWMQYALWGLAIIGPVMVLYTWLEARDLAPLISLRLIPSVVMSHGHLSLNHRLFGLLVSMMPVLLGTATLIAFAVFFGECAKAHCFSDRSMCSLVWAGGIILFWELIHPLFDALMVYIFLSDANPWRYVDFDITNIRGIVIGLVITAMACVLRKGRMLQDEADLTV
jgi:hypothetical protein